jgi:hypothetical protein
MKSLYWVVLILSICSVYAANPTVTPSTNATNRYADEYIGTFCQADDSDDDNVTIQYKIYLNGSLNKSGSHSIWSCFHEDADEAECGAATYFNPYSLYNSWLAPVGNAYDTNYSSSTYPVLYNPDVNTWYFQTSYYINYGVVNATYRIKTTTLDTQVDVPEQCWNGTLIRPRFYYRINYSGMDEYSYNISCYNGSSYVTMKTGLTNSWGLEKFYEEGLNLTFEISDNDMLVDTISATETTRSDNWTIACLADDGTGTSAWTNTSIIIQNKPSTVDTATLSQNDTSLKLTYTVSDADNDSVQNVSIRWTINGNLQSSFNNLTTVTPSSGTYIANVSVYDGYNWSDYKASNGVTVVGGGGGGSSDVIIINPVCGMGIYKPNTKELFIFADAGEQSYEMTFFNNETNEQPLEFTLKGEIADKCEMQFDYLRISGQSFASNIISCRTGYKYDGTIHVVYGNGLCDTDINVHVDRGSAFKKWFAEVIAGTAGGLVIIMFAAIMLFLAVLVAKIW